MRCHDRQHNLSVYFVTFDLFSLSFLTLMPRLIDQIRLVYEGDDYSLALNFDFIFSLDGNCSKNLRINRFSLLNVGKIGWSYEQINKNSNLAPVM